jgi:hypothetical protein
MNSFDALLTFLSNCFQCNEQSQIIEFEDLPEEQKAIFSYYDKEKHFCFIAKRVGVIIFWDLDSICRPYILLP